jgi:hypothetical protein
MLKNYRVFKDGFPVNGVVRAIHEKDAINQVFVKLSQTTRFSGLRKDQLVAKEVFFGDT